jgi:EmrB/QacA subfamily drug resistance transporter
MQYKYTVLMNTTIASFMAFLDSNIVVISLPTIVRTLRGTTPFDAVWLIMGYSIVSATMLLTLGRLADMFGRVRLYNLGFAVFTAGSALCSAAWSGSSLVVFRMIQGLGGALIFANNSAIITDAFPVNERGRAIGINQVVGIAGSILALVLGGVLTSTLGWRSIFWVNILPGGFATVWAYMRLRELSQPQRAERIDYLGNALFGPGLGFFLLGSTIGALDGFNPLYDALMAAGLVLLALFPLVELRAFHPMMDLKLFRIREFSGAAFSNLLNAVARGGLSLILVLYFQGALLYSALQAGVDLIPFSLAFVSAGPLSGALSDKYGPRLFVIAGVLLGSASLFWFALLPAGAGYVYIAAPMVIGGIGGGMFAAPNLASLMNSVPPPRRGVASGMASLLFNVGSLLSISISFVIMASLIPRNSLELIFAGVAVPGGLNLQIFSKAMHTTFIVLAVLNTLALIPLAYRWLPRRGRMGDAQNSEDPPSINASA